VAGRVVFCGREGEVVAARVGVVAGRGELWQEGWEL
jgi:hypothetical protein